MQYLDNSIENPDPNKKFHYKKKLFNIQIIDNQPKLYRQFKRRNQEFNLPVSITRVVIVNFIKFCPICNLKQIQTVQPRIMLIRSDDFLSRLQIDLVDTRHRPCKRKNRIYNWIAHVMDHFSKFHFLWAQEQKSAEEVCEGVEVHVFAYLLYFKATMD